MTTRRHRVRLRGRDYWPPLRQQAGYPFCYCVCLLSTNITNNRHKGIAGNIMLTVKILYGPLSDLINRLDQANAWILITMAWVNILKQCIGGLSGRILSLILQLGKN